MTSKKKLKRRIRRLERNVESLRSFATETRRKVDPDWRPMYLRDLIPTMTTHLSHIPYSRAIPAEDLRSPSSAPDFSGIWSNRFRTGFSGSSQVIGTDDDVPPVERTKHAVRPVRMPNGEDAPDGVPLTAEERLVYEARDVLRGTMREEFQRILVQHALESGQNFRKLMNEHDEQLLNELRRRGTT